MGRVRFRICSSGGQSAYVFSAAMIQQSLASGKVVQAWDQTSELQTQSSYGGPSDLHSEMWVTLEYDPPRPRLLIRS